MDQNMDSGLPAEHQHSPAVRVNIACPGCPYGGVKCGSRGNPKSPIVILGEAPGIQEIKSGRPFVGPSGSLLQEGLPTGFLIDDAFVLNAVRCIVAGDKKDVSKMHKAIKECRQHVIDQIAEHPRKLIIALGSWACVSITQDPEFKITQRRGELLQIQHPGREFETCVLAPVYHPAFLLRGKGNLKQWRADLTAAIDFSRELGQVEKSQVVKYDAPSFKVLETAEEIKALHQSLWNVAASSGKRPFVAADIETSGFDAQDNYILCVGLYSNTWPEENTAYIIKGDELFEDVESEYKTAVQEFLREEAISWIWHNGKFDIRFLRVNGIQARVDEDTILLSYALDEHQGKHGLEDLAKDLLKAPNYKGELKKYLKNRKDSYAKVPKPVLYDYLAKDVKNTFEIWPILRKQVKADSSLDRLYKETLLPAAELLARVEHRGIYIDKEFVAENEQMLTVELVGIEQELAAIAGKYVNPNSPAQVADYLFNELQLKIKGRRPPSTDKRFLVKLKGHKAVATIMKYRRTAKMLSTYVLPLKSLVRDDGRVHTTYSQTTTTTGRLASKEPNIQNIPRESRFRRMYRAAPGYILIEADYNSAELRMLACLSEDEFLTGVFLDDKRNLHDEVSIAMYGPNFTSDERIRAKAINFGIPYGREAFSIAEEFNITTGEAQRLIDAWFERAPQAAVFIKRCRAAPLAGKSLVTVFGRKRRPGVVSYELIEGLQNEFANFPMQSTVADLCTKAAYRLEISGLLHKHEAGIVNLVHDSILVECIDEPERIAEVKRLMKEVMESVSLEFLTTPITFKVDFKQGTHWGLLK
jgi:uracil-DNA glycosylase family 4